MVFKHLIALSFLILFLYTATSKLLNYSQFVYQLRISPFAIVSYWSEVLGYVIPIIELLFVIYLAVGVLLTKYLNKSIVAAVVLISIFEIYIIGMLLSGLDLPCSCGGIVSLMSWKAHLVFNGIFIFAGLFSLKTQNLVFQRNRLSI